VKADRVIEMAYAAQGDLIASGVTHRRRAGGARRTISAPADITDAGRSGADRGRAGRMAQRHGRLRTAGCAMRCRLQASAKGELAHVPGSWRCMLLFEQATASGAGLGEGPRTTTAIAFLKDVSCGACGAGPAGECDAAKRATMAC
jgi:hypothetical protein